MRAERAEGTETHLRADETVRGVVCRLLLEREEREVRFESRERRERGEVYEEREERSQTHISELTRRY